MSILFFTTSTFSEEKFKLIEVSKKLSEPWGMTFVDNDNLLITEKSGSIMRIDMKTGKQNPIQHDLDFYYYGQGGLLDILYKDGYVYVSYSEDRGEGSTCLLYTSPSPRDRG